MNSILAFIKLIRFPNLLIIVLTQYAIHFGLMGAYGVDFQMSNNLFFLLVLSTVMVAAGGYIINDYFDVKVDRVNRPEKIIIGKYIKRRVAMGAHLVINGLAIIIAGYVAYKIGNIKLAGIQVFSFGALWYYSTMFKKQVIIGNIIVALLAALVPLVAGIYEILMQFQNIDNIVNGLLFFEEPGTLFNDEKLKVWFTLKNMMLWIGGFSLFAFMSTMIREIIKDIEDYEGDKKYYSFTLPVVYGKKIGGLVAQIIAIIMVLLMGCLQYIRFNADDMLSVMYFTFSIQFPLIFLIYKLQMAKQKSDYSYLSKLMKVVMLAGIFYTFIFYYIVTNHQ